MQNTSTNVSNTTAKTINTMPGTVNEGVQGASPPPPKGTVESAKTYASNKMHDANQREDSGSQQNMLP